MTIDPSGLSQKEAEAAARGCITKFSTSRRFLIRCADLFLPPLVGLVNRLRSDHKNSSSSIENILVIEGGQLGDLALLLPFLQNLRFHYSTGRIALLANPRVFSLLENLELVDELIPLEIPWIAGTSRWRKYSILFSNWAEFVRRLSQIYRRDISLALCARADIRDNCLLWLTGARRRIGYGYYGGSCFLTDNAVPDLDHPHYAERWLRLLEHLGKPIVDRQPRLQVNSVERETADRYLESLGIRNCDKIIGIHPGARNPVRQWGAENFKNSGEYLAAKIGAKIVWFEDPNALSRVSTDGVFVSVSVPLRQFMAVLLRCNLLICNDSGPMHIATALGVPVVAIFGPNKPQWFGPLGTQNKVVINEGFWCRPCGDRCIFDQPYCLRSISVEQVVRAALSLLGISTSVCSGDRHMPANSLARKSSAD